MPSTTVLLQPTCLLHRFIRKKDTSTVVERPERLRAVLVGVAASIAKLEQDSHLLPLVATSQPDLLVEGDLVDALRQLDLTDKAKIDISTVIDIQTSHRSVNLSSHPAVRLVHGEGGEYIGKLKHWASTSEENIRTGIRSEIPSELPQGDLFLCPQSIDAISGAVAAVCQGVDMVFESVPSPITQDLSQAPAQNIKRAFIAIRPPGHHCSDDTPSGFCFVNNVLVGAAHAHIQHGVRRAVIFDIDLHHGNGTQAIAWSINSESCRQELESSARVEAGQSPLIPGLKVCYGSLHDILSFPCEDGNPGLVQAASTSLQGAHGQYIENVHLGIYTSEEDFYDRLYPTYRDKLLSNASKFLQETSGPESDTIVFISAGFDASSHEYSHMSRHGRNVPTSFYSRFASDVRSFADQYAQGRIVSVLEGGYSNTALISGVGSFLEGLAGESNADVESSPIKGEWWNVHRLEQLEKLTKPVARGSRPRLSNVIGASTEESAWYSRTLSLLGALDPVFFAPLPPLPRLGPRNLLAGPTTRMNLRERKKPESNSNDGVQPAKRNRKSLSSPGSSTKASRRSIEPILPDQGDSLLEPKSEPVARSTTPPHSPLDQPPIKIRIKIPPRPAVDPILPA